MDQPTSKIIGKLAMLIGTVILFIAALSDPFLGFIGAPIVVIGRVMDEYFEDWFDW
jgi:hypothetical protein